jgi:hypothetical protein
MITVRAFKMPKKTAESIKSLEINDAELVHPAEICNAFI